MDIAVVAVTYNRLASLKRLLESLSNANYPSNQEITLIISVDKSNTDIVERFADDYQWSHGEKIVDKHEKNLGLRPHMLSLGKWFDRFDAIVVLEDDIIVSSNYYYYTEQAVEKYSNCEDVAGISLYGYSVNYQTAHPFVPIKNEYDAYFMNCAMSWGEVWMRDSWNRFYEWYLSHKEFRITPQLPNRVCSWNEKSWLKFHTCYCIEENKYFVFPYVSLSSNYGDAGEHNKGTASTLFQVELQQGRKNHFDLPNMDDSAVYYDGFFENKALYKVLGYTEDELCLDLQGESKNRVGKRYWLTDKVANYQVVRQFGLNYRPIEMNILNENPGKDLFLYDTRIAATNKNNNNNCTLLYNYRLNSMLFFMKQYGAFHIVKDVWDYIVSKAIHVFSHK